MSEREQSPLKLPVTVEELPLLDDLVVEAICLEQRYSILKFASTFIGYGWSTEQITHIAAHWPWEWLARAVGHERQQRGLEPVAVAALDKLRTEPPVAGKVPPQPPVRGA